MNEYFNELWGALLEVSPEYADVYKNAEEFSQELLDDDMFAAEIYEWLEEKNHSIVKKYNRQAHSNAIFKSKENTLLQKKYPNINLSSIEKETEPKEKKEDKKEEKKEVKPDTSQDSLYKNFGMIVTDKGTLMPGDPGYEQAEKDYLASKSADKNLIKPGQKTDFSITEMLDAQPLVHITDLKGVGEPGFQLPTTTSYEQLTKGKYRWSDGTYHDERESITSPGSPSKIKFKGSEKDTFSDLDKDWKKEKDKEDLVKVQSYFDNKKQNPFLFNPNKSRLNVAQGIKPGGAAGRTSTTIKRLAYPNLDIENASLNQDFWNPQTIEWLQANFGAFRDAEKYANYLKQKEARDWRVANGYTGEAGTRDAISQQYFPPEYPEQFTPGVVRPGWEFGGDEVMFNYGKEVMTDGTYMATMEAMVYDWLNSDPVGQQFYQTWMSQSADILQNEYKENVYNDYLNGTKDITGYGFMGAEDAPDFSTVGVETGEVDPITGIKLKEIQGAKDNPLVAQVATKQWMSWNSWNNVTNQIGAGERFSKSDAKQALTIQQEGWGLYNEYKTELTNLATKLYKDAGIQSEKAYQVATLEAARQMPANKWREGVLIKHNEVYQKFLKSKLKDGAVDVPVMIWGFDQDTGEKKLIGENTENISEAQRKEIQQIQELYNSVTNGMFTTDNVEKTIQNLEYELLYSLAEIGTQGGKSNFSDRPLYGGATLYEEGFDIDGVSDTGFFSYLVKEMADSKDIASFIAKANNSKMLGSLEPLDNPTDNPLINFYNAKLNTYRALGEAYVMNYNPVETLVTGEGEDVDFLTDPSSWLWETMKSVGYGISTSKETFFNIEDYDQEDLNYEFVQSLESQPELTPYTEKEIKEIKSTYAEKYVNVGTAVKIGRGLPTFGAMAVEIAAIELATMGTGSGAVAVRAPMYLQRLYRAFGAGRKTAKVMSGISKQYMKEVVNLHGSNYLGAQLWGREEMPVYTFAAGSTFAHFGMASLGRGWKLFDRTMKRNTTPAGALWRTAGNAFAVTPSFVKNPILYPTKKFTQAGMGVTAIKAGEFTSGLYDVATGELTMEEMWKHVSDTDSLIELFGTMLAMGGRSGLKDTANGIKGAFADFKKLSSPYTTKTLNNSVIKRWSDGDYGLGKKKKFNKNIFDRDWKNSGEGEFGGESFWGKLEIEAKQNELILELDGLSSKEIQKKYGVKTYEEAVEVIKSEGNALKVNQQIQFYRANQTKLEQMLFGKGSFFGDFNGIMNRFTNNKGALDVTDRLRLGEIASSSDFNNVVLEVMQKTGTTEGQAIALVNNSKALATAVEGRQFKRGGKLERRFLENTQKMLDISSQKEVLKVQLEKKLISEAQYKIKLEELKELDNEYLEAEKRITKENELEIDAEIERQAKKDGASEVFIAKEGQNVAELAKELGIERTDISENEYGGEYTKDGKSVILVDKALASKAQTRFFSSTKAKQYRQALNKLNERFEAGKINKEKYEQRKQKLAEDLRKSEIKQNQGLVQAIMKGEGGISRPANREVIFHEKVHPLVERLFSSKNPKIRAEGKKIVEDFIDILKQKGEYEIVWNKLKDHTDVKGNKNYRGAEWFTVFGELVKGGRLDALVESTPSVSRAWKNLSSRITKFIKGESAIKDYKLSDGASAREFIKNFAKGESKAIKQAKAESKKWIEGEAAELDLELNKASIRDAEVEMLDIYERNKEDWNEGGGQRALEQMMPEYNEAGEIVYEGVLDKLIGSYIPYPRPKGWTDKVNDAFVKDVYADATQLITGFDSSLQTKSGAKGFFAYVNSFLRFKTLNVLKEIDAFTGGNKKSLDTMKEEVGFDLAAPEASTEVYKPKTSTEVAKDIKLSETAIKELDSQLSELDSPALIEAFDTPAGRNQTISPFIREFRKDFGKKGQKAVAKSMGKGQAYKDYLYENMGEIINNVPIGYVSRNFPYLVTKGETGTVGTTGRDLRWTSGPKGMKIKEGLTEADRKQFVYDLTEVGRLSTKKNALAYQLADSYGVKKFTESLQAQRNNAGEILKLEGDFELTQNEYRENKISKEDFQERRSEYVSEMSRLLKESNMMDNFNKNLSPESVITPETIAQKLSQQIEVSNFRKSATLNKEFRKFAEEMAESTGELPDNFYLEAQENFQSKKPLLVVDLLSRKKDIILSRKDFREAFQKIYGEVEFVKGKKLSKQDITKIAHEMFDQSAYVEKHYEVARQRRLEDVKNNKQSREELMFNLERQFDKAFENTQENVRLKQQLGVEGTAKELMNKEGQVDKNILHEENYWIKRLNNSTNKVNEIVSILKGNLGHYASAGGARGHRQQFFSGKPDVFAEMNKTFKDLGLDIEIQWDTAADGSLKAKSTRILKNGKEVVSGAELADRLFQPSQKAEGKWLKLTNQEWIDKNPKEFEALRKEFVERGIAAGENKQAIIDKIEYDFASFKLGQIDAVTQFLSIDQLNTNMIGALRAGAPLHSVMKPFEGDIVDVLTLEHMRAAQVLVDGLVSISRRADSWKGINEKGLETNNLKETVDYKFSDSALDMINKLYEKYNTAIITQEKLGVTAGESVDALITSVGNKTKEPFVARGYDGELIYPRLINEATAGSPFFRSMIDLQKLFETGKVSEAEYGKTLAELARMNNKKSVVEADKVELEGSGIYNKSSLKGKTVPEMVESTSKMDQALDNSRKINPKVKKARVFDFDDTVARTNSKVFATKGGEKKILTAEEFAKEGERLVNEGWKMDFSDFNKVVDGKKGPLFDLMKKMKEAEGDRDMFILTARSQESAPAIHEFLKAMGIDIPLENIKGLGNSTGEAKAEWLVDKAAEGYNDFYFADDAIANVEAVRKALEPIDVKSQVQQARMNKSSVDMNETFNKYLEAKTGIEWQKEFSPAKAAVRGAKKGRFKFWIPPSASDFSGLMDATLGKGKKGEAQRDFYNEVLYKPYSRAQRSVSRDRIQLMADFKALKKELNVPKDLRKITESGFSKEQAVRVHLWNKLGMEIPGLSKTDLAELNKIVTEDVTLMAFAEQILSITKGDGYAKPGKHWLAGTITSDFMNLLNTTKRSKYLQEWQANVDVLFSKANLNKLEAAYGPKYREALENTLARMKAGKNRIQGGNRLSDRVLDYINNAQGTIMFFNMRSAVLQGLSSTNFLNFGFNNPVKAGKAFANQKQYWKDFMEIMNSEYLVDRRNGLKINIAENEIADAAATGKNKAKAVINYILEKGYLPTKFMDSFAIASGGATWYRNRINDLIKKGKSEAEAKEIATEEFIEISEKSQQSSDPSKISQQQSSDMGRILLQFVNTPMQYARLQKAEALDIVNRRGNPLKKAAKIMYYGAVQNMWFNLMQQGLFAIGFDEDMGDADIENKVADGVNGMADSILRGLGFGGMTVSVLKNFLIDVYERSGKKNPKYKESLFKLLEFSPAIKSKFSKLSSVAWMMEDKVTLDQMKTEGFSLDNPAWKAAAKILSATVNLPLDRAYQKMENVQFAMDEETEAWQSVFAWLGWPEYQLTNMQDKEAKRQKEKDDLHYRTAVEDPSKYTKEEQVDILKQHGYTDEDIKKMKNEGTRVATIKKAEQDNEVIYTSDKSRGKKPAKKEEKTYSPYLKEEEASKLSGESDEDRRTTLNVKKYRDMNKTEQEQKLWDLGYTKKYIRSLNTEDKRVDVLLREIENDSIPARLKKSSPIPKSQRTKQQHRLYDLNKQAQVDTLLSLGLSDSLVNALTYEADRVKKIEELYEERNK